MKPLNRLWITSICAIGCLLGAWHWFHVRPVYAQQSTGEYDDGTFYIAAWVDVDSSYNAYFESYMEVEYDFYDEIDEIEVDGYADEDGGPLHGGYGYEYGDDYDPAEVYLQSEAPVPPGHEYGMESDGYAYVCYDDGEGDDDCDWYYIGTANADVYVTAPSPQITSLSTYSVNQGDQGTLTITGSNLVEYSGDQLTINFTGSGSPFTPTGTPSSSTASFSYNFSGYTAGTYTLSVTNNEGTSNNESFTVVVAAPPNPPPTSPPPDPCAVTSNPQSGYSSIVSTGTTGGSGTMAVSFSGAAFATISPTVTYGPYSTPNSIAASIAAIITKNYFKYGLSAKAFGPHIVYSGNATLGTVSNVTTGPSFTTSTSSTSASETQMACYLSGTTSGTSLYYNIVYKTYIPVDNLPGPSPCTLGPLYIPTILALDYLGDASLFSATGYRIQETDAVSTNSYLGTVEAPPTPAAGKTVNFATLGAPPPAITLGQFLEPNPLSTTANPGTRFNPTYPWEYQCNSPLENAFGYAGLTQVGGTSSSSSANSVVTEFSGLAQDPLEPQVGGINWDLRNFCTSSASTV
jgi:hypothetical protein